MKKLNTKMNKIKQNVVDDNIINMNNKSPLRYPGGKTRACKIIDKILNEETTIKDYKVLLSPFFGGGSFEFFVQNKYNLPIKANDKFLPLISFWEKAKYKKNELCDKVTELRPASKEDFYKYRKRVMTTKNKLNRAAYYFVLNRCSFSGSTLSGGYSKQSANKRFTESSIDRIKKLDLSHVNFYNEDCIDFITNNVTEDSLLFLDPPYYIKDKLYGYNGDMHESFDHIALANTLKKHDNWILCYNNDKYIKKLYKDYEIKEVNWSYGMNKSKKSSEILILNFD